MGFRGLGIRYEVSKNKRNLRVNSKIKRGPHKFRNQHKVRGSYFLIEGSYP